MRFVFFAFVVVIVAAAVAVVVLLCGCVCCCFVVSIVLFCCVAFFFVLLCSFWFVLFCYFNSLHCWVEGSYLLFCVEPDSVFFSGLGNIYFTGKRLVVRVHSFSSMGMGICRWFRGGCTNNERQNNGSKQTCRQAEHERQHWFW